MSKMILSFIEEAKNIYGNEFIPLHRPVFEGNERAYLIDCIDSNFVSSVGERVSKFEELIAEYTGASHAIATVNGTAALHTALVVAGIKRGEEVITQALTFVATCNAISYTGAVPVFVDVDLDTMGMSPTSLSEFLKNNAEKRDGKAWNKETGRLISGCIPMHTFGLPCRINEIRSICKEWGISLVEDAAESLGSYIKGKHTGTIGKIGTLSFNGNKLITTGGGGMLITDCPEIAKKAKHISTTAKIPHSYEFIHDEVGYNYRMPNINAALGCAQIEKIDYFLKAKKEVSARWDNFFSEYNVTFKKPIDGNTANFWLNVVIMKSKEERDHFLELTNESGVMTRPIWQLMSRLPMFSNCQNVGLQNSKWLAERAVNIPSSVPNKITA